MTPPKTRTGQKKLSEVARHICRPTGIVSTGFPAVQKRAVAMGIPFDSWQQGVGRLALAKRADGLYAAGIGGVILSIPRQVGKTYLIAGIVFALASLFPNLTIIWTAHRTRTHNETFKKMQGMARKPKVKPWIASVRATNGEQEITFKNGSRIMFGARESGFGRGFDKVDILVLDEAQILSEDAMTDMVPATNAAPDGLVFMMGTPPRPRDQGDVFRSARADALDGDPDRLYIELSADEDAKISDRQQLAKANPSYPHRTTDAAIERMKKLLGSDENFRREAFGIWDKAEANKLAIPATAWDARAIAKSEVPTEGVKAFGVKFTADGAEVALSAAIRPQLGAIHVEGIRSAPTSDGIEWLVEWLVARKSTAAQIVVDGRSGTGYLIQALRDRGVPQKAIITPTVEQVTTAHSMLATALTEPDLLTHRAQPELDEQAHTAQRRKIGTNGGFGWQPSEGGTVALLDASTLAYWAAKTTTRKPGRKAGVL